MKMLIRMEKDKGLDECGWVEKKSMWVKCMSVRMVGLCRFNGWIWMEIADRAWRRRIKMMNVCQFLYRNGCGWISINEWEWSYWMEVGMIEFRFPLWMELHKCGWKWQWMNWNVRGSWMWMGLDEWLEMQNGWMIGSEDGGIGEWFCVRGSFSHASLLSIICSK